MLTQQGKQYLSHPCHSPLNGQRCHWAPVDQPGCSTGHMHMHMHSVHHQPTWARLGLTAIASSEHGAAQLSLPWPSSHMEDTASMCWSLAGVLACDLDLRPWASSSWCHVCTWAYGVGTQLCVTREHGLRPSRWLPQLPMLTQGEVQRGR